MEPTPNSLSEIKESKGKDKLNFQSAVIGSSRYKVLKLFFFKERRFLKLVIGFFIMAGIFYPYPQVAMWLGFAFAGYSAIANDSIQTIGTFLSSNSQRKWWQLWLYIGGIFIVTISVSWVIFDGDVSYQRLTSKGFSEAPQNFAFLQIAAPLVLLLLTRLRMPVSTTFLLLSAFSADASGILSVTQKSMSGYFIAFGSAIAIWFFFSALIKKFTSGVPASYWTPIQWVVSGILWSVWLMQDAANIAIFLPRSLSLIELIVFVSYIFFGLGILFYLRGDKIQRVITEKSEVSDVRGATLIDFVYAGVLLYFQWYSHIPMSTTWVFIGLLGGREIAMSLSNSYETKRPIKDTLKIVSRDVGFALIGLVISMILAIAVNPVIQKQIIEFFN